MSIYLPIIIIDGQLAVAVGVSLANIAISGLLAGQVFGLQDVWVYI